MSLRPTREVHSDRGARTHDAVKAETGAPSVSNEFHENIKSQASGTLHPQNGLQTLE